MQTREWKCATMFSYKLCLTILCFSLIAPYQNPSAMNVGTRNIVKRDAISRTLYREKVDPHMGGKVPEAHYHREQFNKLDATGLAEPLAQVMSERLKNKKLPQKTDSETTHVLAAEDDAVALPFTFSSSNFPSFADEFPFESNKVFNFKENQEHQNPVYPVSNDINPYRDDVPKHPKETGYHDGGGGYGDIPKKKPHLFTQDPYVSGIAENDYGNQPKFKPPPQGYQPPVGPYNTEFDGYKAVDDGYHEDIDYHLPPPDHQPYHPPYHPDEDVYHDPEFGPEYTPPHADYAPHNDYGPVHEEYVPVHDDYGPVPIHDDYGPPPSDGYGPPSSDYGAPSADYGPPKIVGPVLLEKRPYEVKEIRAVPIVTHETYTKFDCRNVPYPDRHYADPEAGCAVYHFCHGYGKQDTFYCPYGTIFNEYLGTCDYKNNVKCSGSGEGYKGPLPKPHHEPHHDSYHPPPHDDYHAPHQPYKTHVSYHEHEQYHPPHDAYGAPPHDAYGPPPHESYEPPHHAYDPHEDSYHEPPPYHIDSYKHEDGYNGDGFRGEKHSPFSEGFGSGFGESHGFGPGFVSQDLRRSDNERSREPPSRPHRGSRRRETPRKLNFDLHKEDFKDIPAEGEFGFDGLKAYGFGLRL